MKPVGRRVTTVLLRDVEGNALPFSPAYNVDNLLFKHVIPTIYNIEGSVINAIYVKAYANMKLSENLGFTPQVLFAWNDETMLFRLLTAGFWFRYYDD